METNTNVSNNSITFHHYVEGDFFEEMYSNTLLKHLTVTTFFIGSVFGLALQFGIIWYERYGNHNFRTVINQLFSTIAWLVVSFILLVYIPEGIRYLTGPLDDTFCKIQCFLKNFLCSSTILTLDCIILLRYMFVFKLTNFAVVNDDLIARFLQNSILCLSFWSSVVKRMSTGRMPLGYFMCAGKSPDDENSSETSDSITRKFDTTAIVISISFILHIFVSVKIFQYQREAEQAPIELGRIDGLENDPQQRSVSWCNDGNKVNSNLFKSMADLTTQMLCLVFLVIAAIVSNIMNRTEPVKLNEYPNRWLAYFIQIVAVALGILGISAQYYFKNTSLRRAVWRKIKELFYC